MSNLAGISLLLPVGSTFDLPTPRRPGLADLQADEKDDDAEAPPEAGMPCAGEFNNGAATLANVARTGPLMLVSGSIPNLGGSLALASFASISDNATIGMLTSARTPGGASSGDFTITWPANMLPPAVQVQATVQAPSGGVPPTIAAGVTANSIRVVTTNSTTGAAADVPFSVVIW